MDDVGRDVNSGIRPVHELAIHPDLAGPGKSHDVLLFPIVTGADMAPRERGAMRQVRSGRAGCPGSQSEGRLLSLPAERAAVGPGVKWLAAMPAEARLRGFAGFEPRVNLGDLSVRVAGRGRS